MNALKNIESALFQDKNQVVCYIALALLLCHITHDVMDHGCGVDFSIDQNGIHFSLAQPVAVD